MKTEKLTIAGQTFESRLIAGTGKFSSPEIARRALDAAGTRLVTVAVRRVNLADPQGDDVLSVVDPKKFTILPNTAGCFSADEAIRTARLGREAGFSALVKLEVIGDPNTLFPDNEALLEATRVLVKEGFTVRPYTNDHLINDAAIAMEAGADGVLMNTGIAQARDPVRMARAMRLAVESGRLAFESGRIPRKLYASASSPLEGVVK